VNLQETIALISALKEAGATHFKSNDFEVTLGKENNVESGDERRSEETIRRQAWPTESQLAEPEGPIDQEKTQKIEEVIDLLKLKDEDLVNKIFPEGAL
jgi:hypothetical protein